MDGKHDIPPFVFLKTKTFFFSKQSVVRVVKRACILVPVRLSTTDLSDIFCFLNKFALKWSYCRFFYEIKYARKDSITTTICCQKNVLFQMNGSEICVFIAKNI